MKKLKTLHRGHNTRLRLEDIRDEKKGIEIGTEFNEYSYLEDKRGKGDSKGIRIILKIS